MIKYQLSTGKTVLLTMEQYLNMTDLDEQALIANNAGIEINDPFADFNSKSQNTDTEIEIELEELPEEEVIKIKKEFEE